jgi:hypothetical protein
MRRFKRKFAIAGVCGRCGLMKNTLLLILTFILTGVWAVWGQDAQKNPASPYRVGERLSYNLSLGKFTDAGYAEIYVVSRGKLSGKDAVELQAKFKTANLVSAFYLVDETRLTYASTETNLPLYSKTVSNEGVLPREAAKNFLINPAVYPDLLTAIYHARSLNGNGNITFQENERTFGVTLQSAAAAERVKTDAGEFETTVSTLQSLYFDELGWTNVRINFSNDETRLPVLVRFKTQKGEFRAALASIQLILPESQVEPTPVLTPVTAVPTPQPVQTPRPQPTPTPYVENQPLPEDLPFRLGETLSYRVTSQNQSIGIVTAQVKQRRLFSKNDSVQLSVVVTGAGQQPGILNPGDSIVSHVDPATLAPLNIEMKLSGALGSYNQVVQFDQNLGFAVDNAANRSEIPIGTHSLLSLAYAVRSFNLTTSKNPTNPVNDTRVAVFFAGQPYVLTLRPLNTETIDLDGKKISAQVVSITSGNPQFDQLNLRVWLSTDQNRLPLRLVVGSYQADLLSVAYSPVK